MSRFNFYQESKVSRNTAPAKAKTPRQHGIIAVYKEKEGRGSFYAKVNNKLYFIENYKLTKGKVYSKPANDYYPLWTMKDMEKDLTLNVNMDNYLKLDKLWASLYDGQVITGILTGGMFNMKSKTDKLFNDVQDN